MQTDFDAGSFGQVVYNLSSEDTNKPFAISSQSGLITVSSEIDYETVPSYTLTVIAEDLADINERRYIYI